MLPGGPVRQPYAWGQLFSPSQGLRILLQLKMPFPACRLRSANCCFLVADNTALMFYTYLLFLFYVFCIYSLYLGDPVFFCVLLAVFELLLNVYFQIPVLFLFLIMRLIHFITVYQ
jgi:hypothetical protein